MIGGGFIGLEVAAAARTLGYRVSVIEAQARILMPGVPAEIAAMIHAEHERQGVRMLCGRSISGIDDADDRALVQLADGEAVEADLVLIAIGVQPDTALAEASGLAVENGVVVDDRLRTSDLRSSLPATAVPSRASLWRTTGATRVLGAAPRNRVTCGDEHAWRQPGPYFGAVVLVGSVSSRNADRRPAGRRLEAVRRDLGKNA